MVSTQEQETLQLRALNLQTSIKGWIKAHFPSLPSLYGEIAATRYHAISTKHCGCCRYYSDCREAKPSEFAQSDEDAERLWELSAELTGVGKDLNE